MSGQLPTASDPDAEDAVRRRVQAELTRARRRIGTVRGLFGGAAAWTVVYLVFVIWMQYGSGGLLRVPPALFWALAVGCGAAGTVMVIGAVQVVRRPVGWTLLIAGVATLASLNGVASLARAPDGVSGLGWWVTLASAVLWTVSALGLWALLRTAYDLRDLYDEYPEVEDAMVRGRRSRDLREGGTAARTRDPDRRVIRRSTRRLVVFGGPAVVALVALGFLFVVARRAPAVHDTAARFARTVESGRVEDVPAFWSPKSRRDRRRTLIRRFRQRGWDVDPPRLGEPAMELGASGSHAAIVRWTHDAGVLETEWVRTDRRWFIVGMAFRK